MAWAKRFDAIWAIGIENIRLEVVQPFQVPSLLDAKHHVLGSSCHIVLALRDSSYVVGNSITVELVFAAVVAEVWFVEKKGGW